MMGLGDLQKTNMTLQLADITYRKPSGILLDVPIVVDKFAYPVDFVMLEMDGIGKKVQLNSHRGGRAPRRDLVQLPHIS